MKLKEEQRIRRNCLLREFRGAMWAVEYPSAWSGKMSELLALFGVPISDASLRNYAADHKTSDAKVLDCD